MNLIVQASKLFDCKKCINQVYEELLQKHCVGSLGFLKVGSQSCFWQYTLEFV